MSEPGGMGATDVAAILAPIPRARFVAALLALHKVDARVLETSAGPFAVLDDASAESVEAAARAVSGFVKNAEFLVLEQRADHVDAHVWKGGTSAREIPAGLALNDAPGVLTSIITGSQTLDEVAETHPDKVHGTSMGRLAAYRQLIKETRALRKDQA